MDDRAMQAHITELESELAFQGQTIRDLNDALARQQQDLLTLQRQVTLLGEQLRNLRQSAPAGGQTDALEKPPHY